MSPQTTILRQWCETFIRKPLGFAVQGLENEPVSEREAATLLLPLDRPRFEMLKQKIKEWADEVALVAENYPHDKERLYQVSLHLTPVTLKKRRKDIS